MHLIVTTDGSARPSNPGPMEIGGIYRTEDDIVKGYFTKRLQRGTNNQAEYWAALYGIRRAIEEGATSVTLEVDSSLIANQISGVYRVKSVPLRKILRKIRDSLGDIPLDVNWAKRNVGARPIADALSRGDKNLALELIAVRYPHSETGTLRFWENPPDIDPDELEELEEEFHKFDFTSEDL